MQLGLIGLGRMGANMALRLVRAGHEVVVFDRNAAAVADLAKQGAVASHSMADLAAKLRGPRHVWLMIPAGVVDATIDELAPCWRAATPSSTAATAGTRTTSAAARRWRRRA